MDAESDLGSRGNFIVELRTVRKEVEMVRCGGATRKGEFGQCGGSRCKNVFGSETSPNGIEGLEPVEEVGILRGRDGARESLVEVMMRVDETRQDDVTCEVEDFVGGLGEVGGFTDLLDEAVANKKTTVREFGLVVIHGEEMGVFDEESCHELLAS